MQLAFTIPSPPYTSKPSAVGEGALFGDEVLDQVAGKEAYLFTDEFSGYHQVRITVEDKKKTTFTAEWGRIRVP